MLSFFCPSHRICLFPPGFEGLSGLPPVYRRAFSWAGGFRLDELVKQKECHGCKPLLFEILRPHGLISCLDADMLRFFLGGILNGIDVVTWNPRLSWLILAYFDRLGRPFTEFNLARTDPHLVMQYDLSSLADGKDRQWQRFASSYIWVLTRLHVKDISRTAGSFGRRLFFSDCLPSCCARNVLACKWMRAWYWSLSLHGAWDGFGLRSRYK